MLTKIGYEGEISAEADLKPLGVGVSVGESHGIEIGVDIGTGVFYDQNEIETHTTTISNTWHLNVIFDKIDGSLGEVDYVVQPYVYWTQNGTLVLDYSVEPKGTWWDYHYGSKPDLAFILPKRYLTEKGENFTTGYEYQRYETKDIIFQPNEFAPGDTVEILTRAHNYSLKEISPTDSVTISYYLGDPHSEGQPINNFLERGITRSSKYDVKQPRGETYFYAKWIVPNDLKTSRFYAVVDPGNSIVELNEDNNMGYVELPDGAITGIRRLADSTQPRDYQLYNNFPNPFNPSTSIRFSIPTPGMVKIDIFNALGRKVETLIDKRLTAGVHEVTFTAKSLSSGIYYFRITANFPIFSSLDTFKI